MSESRHSQLDRLAGRIASGGVAFLIGAGFSLDSEKNFTNTLIARLLARFEALTKLLAANEEAVKLRGGLLTTFWLKEEAGSVFGDAVRKDNLDRLADKYYLINEWMCNAFESLIGVLLALDPGARDACLKVLGPEENSLLTRFRQTLQPVDRAYWDKLTLLHEAARNDPADKAQTVVAGKALFLDTLGFGDEAVMAGEPMVPDMADVLDSYDDRLRPRHFVLAWLAHEGLCPAVITTNYDMLLEGAYRVTGMFPVNPPPVRWQAEEHAAASEDPRLTRFTRIADATDFSAYGVGHQSALIIKIHGCVDAYRNERSREDVGRWRAILSSIVFTFREIQNWRDDSWSRDFVRTLLRTRTVAFGGYSGADPVIHDTFRTVYEEMATYKNRRKRAGLVEERRTGNETPGQKAPAFFFDPEEKREFHGLELLRAASRATGENHPDLTGHPNLATFYYSTDPGFPHLDEVFQWVFHLTYRRLQLQVLHRELRRTIYQLLGRLPSNREVRVLMANFDQLLVQERKIGESLDPKSRAIFRRLTGWTLRFHLPLLDEYAFAEQLLRDPERALEMRERRRYPLYTALAGHESWAAWGIVLEIAIRRAAAVWCGAPDVWNQDTVFLEATADDAPAVLFTTTDNPVRRSLTIEFTGGRRFGAMEPPRRHLELLAPLVWELRSETIPWWHALDTRIPAGTPPASAVWKWATASKLDRKELDRFFGGVSSQEEFASPAA